MFCSGETCVELFSEAVQMSLRARQRVEQWMSEDLQNRPGFSQNFTCGMCLGGSQQDVVVHCFVQVFPRF